MVDILSFEDDGVYVSLSQGNGNAYAAPTRWVTGYGVDD